MHIVGDVPLHNVDQKIAMIGKARELFGIISPCREQINFDECFTNHGDSIIFWFNTKDGSTHIIKEKMI